MFLSQINKVNDKLYQKGASVVVKHQHNHPPAPEFLRQRRDESRTCLLA